MTKKQPTNKAEYEADRREFMQQQADNRKEEMKKQFEVDDKGNLKVHRKGKFIRPGGADSKVEKMISTNTTKAPRQEMPTDRKKSESIKTSDLDENRKLKPLTDQAFIAKYATEKELSDLRKKIESRRSANPEFLELPGGLKISGDHNLFRCSKCKKSFWSGKAADTGYCPCCGKTGFVKKLSKKEENQWIADQKEKRAIWEAEEPERRRKIAEFNERMFSMERDDKSDIRGSFK